MVNIAVLITCHNRKNTTLKCLSCIYGQEFFDSPSLDIYIVDDGSTDGTSEAIKAKHPEVHIIAGNGSMYWCGGMRLAWKTAIENDYDGYLWLNDDTLLFPNAIQILLDTLDNTQKKYGMRGIIVGSTIHPETDTISYGGYMKNKQKPILPTSIPQPCERMNGNIVLVPREVYEKIGILSSKFTHTIGDMEYSVRARKNGIPVIVAPNFQGRCKSHEDVAAWTKSSTPFVKRYELLHGPKGLPPKEYLEYVRLYRGWRWPVEMLKLYLRVIFPQLWDLKKKLKNDYEKN